VQPSNGGLAQAARAANDNGRIPVLRDADIGIGSVTVIEVLA
jgi:hypothetical protein